MNEVLSERNVVQSALWSAYGDALGFITELADEARVEHRVGTTSVQTTVPWRRKVGTRSSVFIDFPAGAYSDDTQLRLSVSRCIRADGSFDVASFAKVELTAWLNYALGAGLASREAAANLARTSANWYSNFFSGKRASYVNSGGNGAAMRIQPHVWSSRKLGDLQTLFRDVIRDTICTHGHPRAFVGACFHAVTLNFAFRNGRAASLAELPRLLEELRVIDRVIETDNDLRLFWVDQWTIASNDKLSAAISRTIDEIHKDIELLGIIDRSDPSEAYHEALISLGALDKSARGSATKTALLASYVASIAPIWPIDKVMVLIANALGSDTDSIGTMAGAILGAFSNADMSHPLQDRDYIVREAQRLHRVSQGHGERSFGYPDLRSWRPERAAVDAIITTEEGLILNGIARASPCSGAFVENDGTCFQWLRLNIGQTILAKMRETPRVVSDLSAHVIRERSHSQLDRTATKIVQRLPDLFSSSGNHADRDHSRPLRTAAKDESLNSLLENVIASGFDPKLIGNLILQQAGDDRADFVERGIALTSTILTAYKARLRRR